MDAGIASMNENWLRHSTLTRKSASRPFTPKSETSAKTIFSIKLVKENDAIFVRDVASSKLVKTKTAEFTRNAGCYHTRDDLGIQESSGQY